MPDPTDAHHYAEFLRRRWPRRTMLLGLYALCGSPVLWLFDVLATRGPAAPSPGWLAAVRLPWAVIPLAGMLAARLAPAWRGLPACIVAASLAWSWGNAWVFMAFGLAGSPLQATALALCIITAATFMPLGLGARAGVFALMVGGQVALDLAWEAPVQLGPRLLSDAAVATVAAVLLFVFENVARSQRRGLELTRHLAATVEALEASRARAAGEVHAVSRLAAEVAHQVNNPLAAVKVNVRWLAEASGAEAAAERAEVVADSLDAVDRIARIVADLKRQAVHHDPALQAATTPVPGAPPAAGAAPDPAQAAGRRLGR